MSFVRKNWQNNPPSRSTPITAEELNRLERGILDSHTNNRSLNDRMDQTEKLSEDFPRIAEEVSSSIRRIVDVETRVDKSLPSIEAAYGHSVTATEAAENASRYRDDIYDRLEEVSETEFPLATEQSSGLMSSKDKIRVNTIPISVKSFGAMGDGSNDDTTAIQTAIDSLSEGDVLSFPPGRYMVSSTISVTKSQISIQGPAILDGSNFPDSNGALLSIEGPENDWETQVTDSDDLYSGSFEIPVQSTSGISPGDWFALVSTEVFNGEDGVGGYGLTTKGEMAQVLSVSSNTIYLDAALSDTYLSGYDRRVIKTEMISEVSISRLTLIGTGNARAVAQPSHPVSPRGIRVTQAVGTTIRECTFKDFARFAIITGESVNMRISDNRFIGRDLTNISNGEEQSDWFTGLYWQRSQGIVFTGNTGENLRRLFDANSSGSGKTVVSRGALVANNYSYNCADGIGTHAASDITVIGNLIRGCRHGIGIRGIDVNISDNTIETYSKGISVGAVWFLNHSDSARNGVVSISNNRIECKTRAIEISGDCEGISVKDNYSRGFTITGLEVLSRTYGPFLCSDNIFIGAGSESVGAVVRNRSGLVQDYLTGFISENQFLDCTNGIILEGSGELWNNNPEDFGDILTISRNSMHNCQRDLTLEGPSNVPYIQGVTGWYPRIVIEGNSFSNDFEDSFFTSSNRFRYLRYPIMKDNFFNGRHYEYTPIDGALGNSNGGTYDPGFKTSHHSLEAGGYEGSICVREGTYAQGVRTGSMEAGSNVLQLSSGLNIGIGTILAIYQAGNEGNQNILRGRVTSVSSDRSRITIDRSAVRTVSGQEVRYGSPTFVEHGPIGT